MVTTAMAALCNCGGTHSTDDTTDSSGGLLVEFEGERLTEDDLALAMPRGVTGEDSVEARNAIIRDWLTDRLLQRAATDALPDDDRERIDRMVEDYRRTLTVDTWRRRVTDSYDDRVPEDSIRRWYATHRAETTVRRPLARGVVIKLPSGSLRLDQARAWVAECSERSIDLIESELLDEAKGYEYFGDRWVDMGDLAEQVPGMPSDPKQLAQWPDDYERSIGGWTCLVHITARLQPGERMPYDYAAPIIAERLSNATARTRLTDLTVRQAAKSARDGSLRVWPEAEEALPFRLVPRGK